MTQITNPVITQVLVGKHILGFNRNGSGLLLDDRSVLTVNTTPICDNDTVDELRFHMNGHWKVIMSDTPITDVRIEHREVHSTYFTAILELYSDSRLIASNELTGKCRPHLGLDEGIPFTKVKPVLGTMAVFRGMF